MVSLNQKYLSMQADTLATPTDENRIIKKWDPLNGAQVSVCVTTYNHAPYLRDALNSILNQKTNFGFEVLVHDDASVDGSRQIVEEYAARYPNIIKPIVQDVNQYSQKRYPSLYFNYPRARLPFMAICEGDDYWLDPYKLQKQVDGLIANPDVDLSFHPAFLVDHSDPQRPVRIYGDYDIRDTRVPFVKVLHRTRGWIPTASCVIRKQAKERFLSFMLAGASYLTVGDIFLQFFGSLSGGALFFAEPMSVYRYRTEQSWTKKTQLDPLFKATHEVAMIRSYGDLNRITESAYHDDFVALTLQRLLWLFADPDASLSRELPRLALLKSVYQECEARIERTLLQLARSDKRYVVFGCGSGCERVLDALPKERIAAVVDRDNRRIGDTIKGKPIIAGGTLHKYTDCALIVSTVLAEREVISATVLEAGIGGSIHYLFDDALSFLRENPIPHELFEF